MFTRLFLLSRTCSSSFSIASGTTIYSGIFSIVIGLYLFYITVTYLIVNVTIHPALHSDPMDTGDFFIFGEIYGCLSLLGNLVKYNPPSIVDLIICQLGNCALIIFIVGLGFFRWSDTALKYLVHPESATAEFFCSVSFLSFIVGARDRLLHTYLFLMPL